MRELSFNVEAARRFGVDGAVMLQGMAAWITKNRANERHFHDGRWWTYNSKAALARLFPFWTEKQLRRIVRNLNEEGALLLGNYSDGSFHNTTWYALSDEVLTLLGAEECVRPYSPESGAEAAETETRAPSVGFADSSLPEGAKDEGRGMGNADGSTCPNGQVTESTCPNGQVHLPERAGTQVCTSNEDRSKQSDTNNPPYKPPEGGMSAAGAFSAIMKAWYREDRKPDAREVQANVDAFARQLSISPSPEAILAALKPWILSGVNLGLPLWKVLDGSVWREDPFFWLFWQIYPRKIDKDRARRAWAKIKPDRALAKTILEALRRWKLCDQWQDERYIPHPATWLNGKRWEASPPGMGGAAAAEETPPEREVEEWT